MVHLSYNAQDPIYDNRGSKNEETDISTSPLHSLPSRKQPFTTIIFKHIFQFQKHTQNAYARRFQPLQSSSSNRAVFNANHGNMLPTEETQRVQLSEIFRCNWRIWFSIFRLLRIEDIMRLSYASREINAMAQSYFNEHSGKIRKAFHKICSCGQFITC
ncbi:conserved hypothetical protein [Trichinella spiralis]|uniref:hypothetical protein n=1 Tax=Trichinella spiralis TaxID=6334 RepID=UPI0001EFDE2B|nr:conserved hypothetical protein [Trichinella spiralis]